MIELGGTITSLGVASRSTPKSIWGTHPPNLTFSSVIGQETPTHRNEL